MNEATLQKIHAELLDHLVGGKFGKIFVMGRDRLAIDMRLPGGNYLFISVNPSSSGIYLIRRKLKELSKQECPTGNFAATLRKRLSNSRLTDIEKLPDERVLELHFDAGEESLSESYVLIVQLTGRSSNLILLDSDRVIIESLRPSFGDGQKKGEKFVVPARPVAVPAKELPAFDSRGFETLSEALDAFYLKKERTERFKSRAASAKALINTEIKKKSKLKKKLAGDLVNHGEPEEWKRLGDLLNANIATATPKDGKVVLVDYFDEALPQIEIEIGERLNVKEAAELYFKKYTKSKNARTEIANRVAVVTKELERLSERSASLDAAIESGEESAVAEFLPASKKENKQKTAVSAVSKYAREFVSSDGLTILVGKRSKDNDHLTFRIAKSLDLWLHAADYPGSHVVIRRDGKKEIPQNTILEAAMIAAFYSKAKKENKAAVRYAERKFVGKQKGAPPGLVSISSSKTIMVKPEIPEHISK